MVIIKNGTKRTSILGYRISSCPCWRNSYQQLQRYELGRFDTLRDGLTETQDILIYISLIYNIQCTRFHILWFYYSQSILLWMCHILSMFRDEKHHQLVTYPVWEVPKTDFCMIWPQLTSTDQSVLAIGYLAISWLSAIYWLAISWLLAGYWLAGYQLAIDWISADYQLIISYLSTGHWLALGWSWAGYGLAISYLSAGCGLAMGWLWVVYGLAMGYSLAGYELAMRWLWAGHHLAISYLLAGYWLAISWL